MWSALLTKLRSHILRILEHVSMPIIALGITPNTITVLSFALALLSILAAFKKSYLIFAALVILSGFMDVLDGFIARKTGKVSRFGAFIDSTIDRVNDSLFIIGLYLLGLDILPTLLLLITSLLISYIRARAEALGVRMEGVGLIERAERLIIITVVAVLLGYIYIAGIILAYILIALSAVTVVQRIIYVYRVLGGASNP